MYEASHGRQENATYKNYSKK